MFTFSKSASLVAVVMGSLVVAAAAFADPPDQFVKKAIQGNIAEVKMGELAQKNGASEGVKSFGKMLVTDHGKAKDQTVALAKTMKIDVPTEPGADAKAAYDKMAKLTGASFDKEFAHHMVMDHKKDIAELGHVKTSDADVLEVECSMETMPSVLWDGVIIPAGAAAGLAETGHTPEFLKDQYRHCKTIMALGDGVDALMKAGLPAALPDGSADPGIIANDEKGETAAAQFAAPLAKHRHFARETDPPRV